LPALKKGIVMDLESIFTLEEKDALQVLKKKGFEVFTDAVIEDVRWFDSSGKRNFRSQVQRYAVVMVLQKVGKVAEIVEAIPEEVIPVKEVVEEAVEIVAEPVIEVVMEKPAEPMPKRTRKKRRSKK
jgi:hypothetical protein